MATKNAIDSNDPVEVAAGGTGAATLTDHGVLVGSGTGAITALAVGATNQVLLGATGSDPTWGAVDLTTDITGTLPVGNGGIGATTLTDHGVLIGSGSSAVTAASVGATGELLVGSTGSDPAFASSADGDFTFTSSTAATTRSFIVENTDNTNSSSAAKIAIESGGSSAGDPKIQFTVTGQQTFSLGIDNDDSDELKISANALIGTTDVLSCSPAGEIRMPLQPAFQARDATASNVTGDGTEYTVSFNDETFDQNADWNGSTTFTAPVTGKYAFTATLRCEGLTSSHTNGILKIATSNHSYWFAYNNFGANKDASDRYTVHGAVLADMDAADTTTLTLTVSAGTKVVDLGDEYKNFFSGYLAC